MAIEKLDFQKLTKEQTPFTVVLNSVLQHLHYPEALALWTYLYSLPTNWAINKEQVKKHFGFGNNKLKQLFSYLQRANLVTYSQARTLDGKMSEAEIHILNGINFNKNEPFLPSYTGGSVTGRPVLAYYKRKSIYKRKNTLSRALARLTVDKFEMDQEKAQLCAARKLNTSVVLAKFKRFFAGEEFTLEEWNSRLEYWINQEKRSPQARPITDVLKQSTSFKVKTETKEENLKKFEAQMKYYQKSQEKK